MIIDSSGQSIKIDRKCKKKSWGMHRARGSDFPPRSRPPVVPSSLKSRIQWLYSWWSPHVALIKIARPWQLQILPQDNFLFVYSKWSHPMYSVWTYRGIDIRMDLWVRVDLFDPQTVFIARCTQLISVVSFFWWCTCISRLTNGSDVSVFYPKNEVLVKVHNPLEN